MAKEPTAQENAQRVLAETKAAQAEAVRLQEERDKATPTPTQDEADLIKLGALPDDGLADSGAPAEQPAAEDATTDATKRARSTSYTTRDAKAE